MASARSTLITVMLVSFMSTAGVALPFPVLAPYFLAGEPGALSGFLGLPPKLLLGILLAVYPLGILIGSSFLGALSDHFGRKRVLVASLCLAALGYLLTAAAVLIESFPLFALARLLTGLCEGNDAIARAVALDLHPAISRSRALSLVFATTYAGWMAGPLAGGYLMVFGMAAVFLFAGAALLACASFTLLALMETSALPASPQSPPALLKTARQHNSLRLWREPPIRELLIFHLLYTLGVNACYEFYPLWLVEYFGSDNRHIAWLTVYMTGAMIFTSMFVVTRLRARCASLTLVRTSSSVFAALLLLLVFTPIEHVPWVFAGLGMTISINSGCFPEYMAERFAHQGAGRVMGLISTNFYASNMLIALAGSVIALAGSQWSLIAGALLCACAVAWLQYTRPPASAQVIEAVT
ncbi:MAG: MFS transporter [Pseudomonadales bacterium]